MIQAESNITTIYLYRLGSYKAYTLSSAPSISACSNSKCSSTGYAFETPLSTYNITYDSTKKQLTFYSVDPSLY